MYTIATAGHIDHGKSSLVRALTGIDPDRLPEEKARQMTIELGFAHFRSSTGAEIGIIDVPGHERFIKTMIAGVGALDLVMFVIAADDGWMPQSAEHLAILRHLGVDRGFIALTKVDLVTDDWRELVKSDLRERVKGTFLEGSDIIEFSAVDNRNLDQLKIQIESHLRSVGRPAELEAARLYVDRVFTVAGAGTVVTGTLRDATLSVGQEIYHHPSGAKTRVKSLESFSDQLVSAKPGIRLAVGLQTLERGEIQRGDLLYTSKSLRESKLIAVAIDTEPSAARHLRNLRDVLLLHGTGETEARLLLPPEPVFTAACAQIAALQLECPVILRAGDRAILRLPTPSLLLGGAAVIDPLLEPFARKDSATWQRLLAASSLTVDALIVHELASRSNVDESALLTQSLLPRAEIETALGQLIRSGVAMKRHRHLLLSSQWRDAQIALLSAVEQFHKTQPHLAAMPLAELASKIAIPETLFADAVGELITSGKLLRQELGVRLAAYSAELSADQQKLRDRILRLLAEGERLAMSRDEIYALDKDARKVFTYLKQNQLLVDINGTIYLKTTFDDITVRIMAHLKQTRKITIAEARDLTGTSRKVVLPILEDLDRRRITRREGDYRFLCE